MESSWLGVILVVAQLVLFVSAQNCLLAAEGRAVPFRDDNTAHRLPSRTQAIITSYKFRCCGNITTWQTYVRPAGGNYQGAYDINFQVWRPSPTVQENGCYSMVGENRFTNISLLKGGLVSETPEPSNILTVQPGDVVGYYTFNSRDKQSNIGDGIQLDSRQSIDSVWYHTDADGEPLIMGEPDCPIPVGTETGRSLISSTNAAPFLAVSVDCQSCPTPSYVSLSSPSLLSPSSSPANSATPFNPTTTTRTTFNSEGSPVLSSAVIASLAAIGGSALMLTLLCPLILAIATVKVQHKRQRTLAETSSVVTDRQVNTLSMMEENGAYETTPRITEERYASLIIMESNLAYETVNTGSEVSSFE